MWPGSAVLVNPADADKLVAEQKAKGYDFHEHEHEHEHDYVRSRLRSR